MGISMDIRKRMEKEVLYELLHYHEKTTKQKLKDMVKKAVGSYVPPKDVIFWPTGLLANALMELEAEKENERVAHIRTYFDRWIKLGMPIHYVDDVLCGVALMDLYRLTKEEKYRIGAERMAEYIFELEQQADAVGSIPYRPTQGNQHIYVDGIGMMCPFLAKYGIAFGKEKAIQIALRQIENMLEYGMDAATGLPYHGFRYENGIKYGIIGWGRAVGWLMLGMAGVLRELKKEALGEKGKVYQEQLLKLEKAYLRLIQAVKPYQKQNGAFGWQLSAMEGPEDSSATAMIAWALLQTAEVIAEEDGRQMFQAAAKYLATCEKDGKIDKCSGECLGFAQYPQVYGTYPWSLGPAYAVLARVE